MKSQKKDRSEELSERARKHLDAAMKAVGKNLKLVAWIAWANNLLFQEKSREEMRVFVKKATEEELEKYFEVLPPAIRDEDKRGVILDVFYAVKKDGKTIAYIDIENELTIHSYERIATRSRVYICSSVIWQKIHVFGSNYKDLREVVGTWIFPKYKTKYLKNTIEFDTILFSSSPYRLDGKTGERSKETNLDLDLRMPLSFYYLGSPFEVDLESTENKFDFKQLNLLRIFDTLFYSEKGISFEEREKIVEFYGLSKELMKTTIEETEEAMNLLETYAQPLREEIEERDKVIYEKDETITIINRENVHLKEENDTVNRENERLSEAYDTVNRENERLSEAYDTVNRENVHLKEESEAQKKKYEAKTKKYEAIIKALKDELASKNDSNEEN